MRWTACNLRIREVLVVDGVELVACDQLQQVRVRLLQRRLRKWLGAKLLATERVTSNRGQKTAGVDGIILSGSSCAIRPSRRSRSGTYCS
jgi:hypothetical protein